MDGLPDEPDVPSLGRFGRQGRLKRAWSRARDESDPARAMVAFREVLEGLGDAPDHFGHLWPDYLDGVTHSARVGALTDDDFDAIEAAAAAFAGSAETRERLAAARTARGEERQARGLLVRVSSDPDADPAVRTRCARELARRGAASDAHLRTYVAHLANGSDDDADDGMRRLLGRALAVDFDADPVRLTRADEVARLLLDHDVALPGIRTALGLTALLSGRVAEAVEHLSAAAKVDRDDAVAALGVLTALLRAGDYARAHAQSAGVRRSVHPDMAGLIDLAAALAWLNSTDRATPPVTAAAVEGACDPKYAPDAMGEAVGRLHLVEGNARAAARVLGPLADELPDRPELSYFAAWASLLTDDDAGLARCVEEVKGGKVEWTVRCVQLDSDWSAARSATALTQPRGAYASVISARTTMARGESPGRLTPVSPPGSIPEAMEELRTHLGRSLRVGEKKAVDSMLATPLFARLPRADATLWRGLVDLTWGTRARGLALLKEAARQGGHPRAALVLAVESLRAGETAEAADYLERGARLRHDPKVELLRAAVAAQQGDVDRAVSRLEACKPRDARTTVALADLYLYRAGSAGRAGYADRARLFRDQAAAALKGALGGSAKLPREYVLLDACLDFTAAPNDAATAFALCWPDVAALRNRERARWLAWHCALARLASGKVEPLGASEVVLDILSVAGPIADELVVGLAQAFAHVATSNGTSSGLENAGALLDQLAPMASDDGVRRWSRLVRAKEAAAHRPEAGAKTQARLERALRADPANAAMVLLLARRCLETGDTAAAVTALRSAPAPHDLASAACASLADLLEGKPPSEALPSPADQPAALRAGVRLLAAAAAFSGGEPDAGYSALMTALQVSNEATERVVKLTRCLVPLVAQTRRGGVMPAQLVHALRQVAASSDRDKDSITLARCAAAVGEADLATNLWESAVRAYDGAAADGEREALAEFLCHTAVAACRRGDEVTAARTLRKASVLVGGEGPAETITTTVPARPRFEAKRRRLPRSRR